MLYVLCIKQLIAMEKNMTELELEMREAQNFWLRLQGHVVSMSQKRSEQLNNIHLARKREYLQLIIKRK